VYFHEKRLSHVESINETSIYPTEDLLWDPDLIPTDEYNGDHCLALPKLNLQFLTFHDYLLRNYDLFRLEACYAIRLDLEDSIRRVNARKVEALPINRN
jgi:intron-binding protein aquarius